MNVNIITTLALLNKVIINCTGYFFRLPVGQKDVVKDLHMALSRLLVSMPFGALPGQSYSLHIFFFRNSSHFTDYLYDSGGVAVSCSKVNALFNCSIDDDAGLAETRETGKEIVVALVSHP